MSPTQDTAQPSDETAAGADSTPDPAIASAAPPAHAAPEPSRRAHVVVEGRKVGDPEDETAPIDERQASRRELRAAGRRAAIAAVPLPGALLLATWPLGSWAWVANHSLALGAVWSVLALSAGLAMLLLPTGGGRAFTGPTPPWAALLTLGGACMALLPWAAGPLASPALTGAAFVWAAVAASVLAPWRPAGAAMAWVPLVAACGAAAVAQGAGLPQATQSAWLWLLSGALAGAATLVLAWQRHAGWKRGERRQRVLEARGRLLEAERDSAVRTDQDKSRFVAIASHDLRQPVHALGLFAATLQKRLQNTPDEALVRNFMRAVDDLERSFSSMLDISRLDGGALTPGLNTFPLRDLFRRLHMQYAGQAELSGLGLRFSTGGKSVTSDPQLLERIVGNLVQNALKYTAQGGVVVVSRSTDTHVNIEIWDTGVGIPATELPRVFEEFYQVAPGRRDRSHGLGMGLAIVKRLTQLLGHRLEVASRPGRGTMFRVGIPIGALPGIQDDLAPADTLPMTVDTPQMVLIVDDEEPIREGLRVLLQEWGYQTITAANAQEAEQAVVALEGRVDLVVSDLQLGVDASEPDGSAVVDTVRRLCGWRVPAVLVTGDTSHQALPALVAGGDPVLFKPVQPRRLFDAMRAALG